MNGVAKLIGCKQFFKENSTNSETVKLLKSALYKYGPLAVSIKVAESRYGYIGNETYGNEACMPNEESGVNHAVILSGWKSDGWEIQNSWSDLWGDEGYGYLKYDYDCGISTMALLPILEYTL